ncbi:MAG: response regulator [Verrucomicrobiota bacterium]
MNAIRILLVDDDEDDYILARDFFSEINGQEYDLEWVATHARALESRKQVMQHRLLDLNEVVENFLQILQRVLGEHIALKFFPSPDLPAIYADSGMLEQVLMNLAVNAREAMPKGGKLIICSNLVRFDKTNLPLNPEARPGKFIALNVTDTGSGLSEKKLLRLFEPFFATKEIGKGTGLGLAAVYGIIKPHHGWIEVDSHLSTGTAFTLYFPATENKLSPKPEAATQFLGQGGNETILVVEDEPALRMLVVEVLQLYGYGIYQASSGLVALDVWKEHKDEIDLLLTDMVMPDGISGRDLAERLLQENPKLKVIYTSGYSPGMAGKDMAAIAGFNFLPKPYPPSRLAEMVRSCLNKPVESKHLPAP